MIRRMVYPWSIPGKAVTAFHGRLDAKSKEMLVFVKDSPVTLLIDLAVQAKFEVEKGVIPRDAVIYSWDRPDNCFYKFRLDEGNHVMLTDPAQIQSIKDFIKVAEATALPAPKPDQ